MSDPLKVLKKAKRVIRDVKFEHDNAALSYTTKEFGGAASMKNEAYLFKSLVDASQNELSEEAAASDGDDTSVNPQEVSKANKIENKEGDQMTDKVNPEVVELRKQLKASKLEKKLGKYGLGEDQVEGLALVLAGQTDEDAKVITEALDKMLTIKGDAEAAHAEELKKAQEAAKEGGEPEETDLQKSLKDEAGHDDVSEPEAKSLVAQAADIIDENKGE